MKLVEPVTVPVRTRLLLGSVVQTEIGPLADKPLKLTVRLVVALLALEATTTNRLLDGL